MVTAQRRAGRRGPARGPRIVGGRLGRGEDCDGVVAGGPTPRRRPGRVARRHPVSRQLGGRHDVSCASVPRPSAGGSGSAGSGSSPYSVVATRAWAKAYRSRPGLTMSAASLPPAPAQCSLGYSRRRHQQGHVNSRPTTARPSSSSRPGPAGRPAWSPPDARWWARSGRDDVSDWWRGESSLRKNGLPLVLRRSSAGARSLPCRWPAHFASTSVRPSSATRSTVGSRAADSIRSASGLPGGGIDGAVRADEQGVPQGGRPGA